MAQGTDIISRGDKLEGAMAGRSMLEYIPLEKGACERSKTPKSWIKTWLGKGSLLLSPKD